MSLRARLIIGVVALAAVGLLVAGGVTYAETRRSLLDRVDQQADAALPVVERALRAKGVGGSGPPDPRAAAPVAAAPIPGRATAIAAPAGLGARGCRPRSTARDATPAGPSSRTSRPACPRARPRPRRLRCPPR